MSTVAVTLAQLITAHFHIDVPASGATPLGQSPSFDSVSLIQLIMLIEERFQIRFDEDELQPELFNDLQSLALLIGNKVERCSDAFREVEFKPFST